MNKIYLYGSLTVVIVNAIFFFIFTLPEKTRADAALFDSGVALTRTRPDNNRHLSNLKLEKDMSEFYSMLTKKENRGALISEVDEIAKASSLSIRDISYAGEKTDLSDISKILFSFYADGKYNGVKSFIRRLESSKSFFVPEEAVVEKTSVNEKIQLKLKVSAYVKN
jgi:hypothetical protein